MNILFVDDYQETRGLFRLFFTLKGHQIHTAHSGEEALELFDQHADTLDVIVLDYHMPDMNGIEVVKHLREKQGAPSVPIIMFTSDQREALESQAQELGVARVVYKPIMPLDLIDVAQDLVNSTAK